MKEIMHGDRVLVFDSLLYKDDVSTPPSHTIRVATVACRYRLKQAAKANWPERIYDDLCDVVFDHRPDVVSKAHFTYGVKLV
jgi:hypothetical protein